MGNAADCHAHVFCGGAYAYSPDTVYEPHLSQAGTTGQFLAVLDAHGLTHGLLVGAGPYGQDNRCMLEGIATAGGRLKGIALVRADVSDRDLASLADRGVVGIRFNPSTHGMSQFAEPGVDRLLARITEMGWFLQVHCEKDELVRRRPGFAGQAFASWSTTSVGLTWRAACPTPRCTHGVAHDADSRRVREGKRRRGGLTTLPAPG